jgi:hypothetical protein
MKRVFSFLTIGLLAVTWGQAQIPLRGIITVHNSRENTGKIEYVSGAQVDCSAAQSTQSGTDGRFVLGVSGLQKGNRVAVYVHPPSGRYKDYVVVNEKSLKEETVLGTDSIWVSICPEGELDRRKAEILDINMDNYVKKKQYNLLKKQLKEEQEKVQRYSEQWNVLRDSLRRIEEDEDRMLKELGNYADQLVRINLDLLDENNPLDISRKKAYQCAQRGELDSVMIYMQDRPELLRKALEEREKTRQKREAAQKIKDASETHKQQQALNIEKLVEDIVLSARIAKEQNNHTEAEKCYQQAIQADSLNYELVFEFAEYLHEIGEYGRAESYYQYCLIHYEQLAEEQPENFPSSLYNTLELLAQTYNLTGNYPLAVNYCRDGNELLDRYKEKINYESMFSSNCGALAYYYLFTREYALSEQTARQALASDNSQIWIKVNLAHALLFQNRVAEAETIYKELSQTVYQDNETYTLSILEDLDALEKAGVIPEERKADVERIRKQLII